MIDMCFDGARVVVERWKQFLLSPVGVYLYSVVTGGLGIIILLVFLSMVLSPGALLILFPFIIAFNSASAGYGLVDKCSAFPRRKTALVTIAALCAATGCLAVTVLFPWEPLFDAVRYGLAAGASLTGVFFGAWIGGKNKKLHQ